MMKTTQDWMNSAARFSFVLQFAMEISVTDFTVFRAVIGFKRSAVQVEQDFLRRVPRRPVSTG